MAICHGSKRHVVVFKEGGREPMVSFQNRERVALVTPISNAQPRLSPRRKLWLMACTLVTQSRTRPLKRLCSDALDNINKQKTAVSDPSPLRRRKNPDELQVWGFDLYFPPLSISWQFMPHVPATAPDVERFRPHLSRQLAIRGARISCDSRETRRDGTRFSGIRR